MRAWLKNRGNSIQRIATYWPVFFAPLPAPVASPRRCLSNQATLCFMMSSTNFGSCGPCAVRGYPRDWGRSTGPGCRI
jgi:hypothetical protein